MLNSKGFTFSKGEILRFCDSKESIIGMGLGLNAGFEQ
jgi:hypothetical protein